MTARQNDTEGGAPVIKTIGIITWFHWRNYGTSLQLTALYETVRRLGCQPKVINYIPKPTVTLPPSGMLALARDIWHTGRDFLRSRKSALSAETEANWQRFLDRLDFSQSADIMGELENLGCDAYICGSDQIWSPVCFDDKYFLSFVSDDTRKIAYAPSIGVPAIEDPDVRTRMKELIERFPHLSVRERQGAELIREWCGKDAFVALDPSLLLTSEQWDDVVGGHAAPAEKYILCYFLGWNRKTWKLVEQIRARLSLPLKVIPVFKRDLKRDTTAPDTAPTEFVDLIRNAAYVCTDSFHGMVFAVLYQRPFSVFERFSKKSKTNQNSRLYHLLDLLGLAGRLVENVEGAENCGKSIVWSDVFVRLGEQREKSLAYLQNALATATRTPVAPSHGPPTAACCGCGACAGVCPSGALKIARNANGFLAAFCDSTQCVSCGECEKVCPFRNTNGLKVVADGVRYSYQSDLERSPSEGARYELAKHYSRSGGDVYADAYVARERGAKHIKVKSGDMDGLLRVAGRQFLQSDFSEVIADIRDAGRAVLFGTPCQIAAVRQMLSAEKQDDILLVDRICDGIPSYNLFEKYLDEANRNYHTGVFPEVIFDRRTGKRRKECICLAGNGRRVIRNRKRDMLFRFFENGHCWAPSCYDCPFGDRSAADIRLGDDRDRSGKHGEIMLTALTGHGHRAVESLKAAAGPVLRPESRHGLFKSAQRAARPVFYDALMRGLRDRTLPLDVLWRQYGRSFEVRRKLYAMAGKFLKIGEENMAAAQIATDPRCRASARTIETPKVSIIIPVYKVDKYLRNCLESCRTQDHRNIEIIVVDDGSPDGCATIMDEFAARDDRFKMIHQSNGGVSTARNAGLDIATGDYYMFIDGDDRVEPDYVSYFVKLAQDTDSDVCVSRKQFQDANDRQTPVEEVTIWTNEEAVQHGFMHGVEIGVWNKIFRADFWRRHHLRFNPNFWFGEGLTIEITAFQLANHVGAGNRKVYHQTRNPESATRKFNFDSWWNSGLTVLKYLKENFVVRSKKVLRAWNFHWWWVHFSIIKEILRSGEVSRYETYFKRCKREVRKYALCQWLNPIPLKLKVFAVAMLISPTLAARFYNWYEKRILDRNERV